MCQIYFFKREILGTFPDLQLLHRDEITEDLEKEYFLDHTKWYFMWSLNPQHSEQSRAAWRPLKLLRQKLPTVLL